MAAVATVAVAAGSCAPAASADLGLTVSGAPDRLIAGDRATLTARVTNLGAEPVVDTRVIFNPRWDPFESQPPKLAGPACDDSLTPPTLNCGLGGVLVQGAWTEVAITAGIPGTGPIEIDVGANAEGEQSAASVYSPSVTWKGTVERKADTKLELTAGPETVANGAEATVRALVTNTTSAATAYGSMVKLAIPPGLDVVSKPADCTGTALNLVCPVGDLGPQLTAQRVLTVRSAQEGSYTVLGSVVWARDDPTPIDTQGQATVTVLAPVDPTEGGAPPAPSPQPAPKPKTVSAGTLAQGVPGAGRCVRARRLNLVLRSLGSWDPIRATVRVTGRRRALVLKGARAQRPFTLTLPRRGGVTLKLAVTLDNGRRYTATRTFRRC